MLNHSVVLAPRLVLESEAQRDRALGVLGTEAFANCTRAQLQRARRAAESGPLAPALRGQATAVYRGGPLGFRVTDFDQDAAPVEWWAFGVAAADEGLDPQMTFQTATTRLVWQDGDWKLDSTRTRPGPVPRVSGTATSGRAFVDGVGQLKELRYGP